MGNTGSNPNSENEDEETPKEAVDDIEKDNSEYDGTLDLTSLFDPKQLRIVADKTKEDSAVNPLQQHHSALVRWLEERRARGAETVTLGQFVESFTNKGVSKQTATEIFQQFDIEGDGVVDLDYLHEMMDLVTRCISGFVGIRCDLPAVNKLLQDCCLAPGFIDAFTSSYFKTAQLNHGQKLFKFLFRNRALSDSLQLPALKSFITTTNMRLKVLRTHLSAMKERDDKNKREPSLQSDEVLKPINRCFTSADVSSNRMDASKLVDNDNGTYWQSDGPARSHWVRLKIPQNVLIKQLSMYVVSLDQSYMPHHVVIYGGRDESNLTEINDVFIPNHITGDFTLLENVKVPYQVIQISIKRCHSDGCDTRIRQIKAIGYRVVKSKGVSVVDATAMWYLSVLAATAQAALPVAPDLRNSIINHTKISLSHMGPLSLSSSSTEKPGFLSTNVMEQMESFLQTIISMNGPPPAEDLIVLLEFAFARGSLGSIFDVLKLLLDQVKEDYPAVPLLLSLSETEDKAVRRHGQKLSSVILSCDGGSRDNSTSPQMVLSENWKTETYFTADGKTKCNIAFGLKSGNLFQLTHVFMKLAKGPIAPRAGMVFVFDSDNIKDENGAALFQPLAQFDSWTEEDYNKFKENSRLEKEWNPINPVAYFTVDKDWADVDISVDRIQVGSCVTIKFLGARQETAERLGITGINLFGYELNEDIVAQQNNLEKQSQLILDDEEAYICGENVLLQTLKFLQIMSRDAVNVKSQGSKETTQEKDTTIDIYDVSMEQIWNVYTLLASSELKSDQLTLASEMVLNLFHMALPYLKPSAQKTRENRRIQQRVKKSNRENQEREYNLFSSDVFQALCDIVDRESPAKGVHKYAKAIILDGAELFFPDAKTRRDHLLSLVDKVMEDGKAVSLAYTFESLCRFFSNKDASGLLGLPDSLPQESFQPESVVHVMKTLVSVAYRESLAQVKQDAGSEVPSNLVLLLCAMQRSLLTWCHTQCSIPAAKGTAFEILVQYVEMLGEKCNCILLKLEKSEDIIKITDRLEYSFVSMAMRQLVLFLNLFSSMEIDFIAIIRHLQSLAYTLAKQTSLLPPLFSKGMMDEESAKNLENTILREWEMESEHDYENNIHITKVFNCTGCTRFRVEFDAKCKTERKFDYLEFTDSSGCKRRFDVAVGTDIWPYTVEFNAGQRLHFLFHSDGSNTDWGYKFKVFAIGSPDVAVNWLYDLQLNLARCFGMFCGNALNSQTALSTKKSCDKDEERALLHNELWSSLFRGGYMVGKLERSLSGFHKSSPFDSNANAFLCEIAANESERAKSVIAKCSAAYTGQRIGTGALFDSAVYAVFAALLWHTQELRDEVTKLTDEEVIGEIPASIINAFSVAENVRRPLLEVRQRLLVQLDDCKPDNAANNESCNPDTPIISCREKALFLLKFAGLSKLKPRKASTHFGMERRNSVLNRPRSATTTSSSYPSFQMIIDFVTNESLSHLKIQDLLQHRCKYAKTVTNIFTFSFEYMNQMMLEDTIQIPVVLFLQNMLASQDYFPQHYADYLNGCGLSLEKMVRKSYYSFIRRLTNVVRDNSNTLTPLFRCTLAYLLHFLDIEWKPYDYEFLAEMQIPYLLVTSMQGMTSLINDGGDAELTMLERHKRFFKEATEEGIDKWCEQNRGKAPLHVQRDINLFIARYSSDLEVVITCDGCTEKIRGGRYRCLNCIDMDLCSSCYMNGMKPNEHSANHKIIHLKYTCDSCEAFIIETRIHCNSCNDFDLCLHCHKNDIYPTYHNPSHSVTKFKLIPQGLTPVKSSEMVALKTYVQQHSWLQFSAIGLSLSESLQSKTVEGIELEYMRAGGNLLLDCLEKTACCLTSSEFTLGRIGKPNSTCSGESGTFSKVKFESIEKVMTITAPSEVNFDAGKISGCDVADVMPLKIQDSADTLSSPSGEVTGIEAKDLIPSLKDENSYFALDTDNGEDDDDTLPALEGDQDEVDGAHCKGEVVTNIDTVSSHDIKDGVQASTTKKINARNSAVDSSKMFMHLMNYVQRCSRTSTHSNTTQSTSVEQTSSTISTGNNSTDGGESTSAKNVTSSETSVEDSSSSKTSTENTTSSETSTENTTSSEISTENVTSSKTSTENVTSSETSTENITGTSSESSTENVTGTSTESTTSSSDAGSGTSSEQVTGTTSTESGTTGTSSVESSSSSESSSNESSSATGTSTESSTTTTTTDTSSSEDSNLQNIINNADTDDEANKTITVQDPVPENKDMKEKEIKDDEQEQLDADLLFKEKVLGLVGAIIPHNREMSNNLLLTPEFQLFFSQKLLPVLFKIICDSNTNIKVHMTALGVMAKILLCFGPEVGDSAVNHVLELEADSSQIPGSVTVNFLFSLGAQWLQKSDLDAASCVEGTLESLWTSEKWKNRIIAHASDTLEGLAEESSDPSLISLFSLMFLAGFPDVLRSGTIAILKEVGGETKQVVIDNPSAEQTQVMNFKNRKRLNVKESNIEPLKPIRGVLEHSKIPLLVGIVEKILADHPKGASSFNISVERMWVLGLICKALLRILKDGIDKDAMLSIIRSGVVPGIINLACQGTGFSKQWMLRDLEVLSWKVYKGGDEMKKQSTEKKSSDSTGTTESSAKKDVTNSLLVCGSKSPLDGLDEDTKLCMETIHDALHCPYPILRAIYEHNGKNREKLLEEVQRNFDGSTGCNIQASPEILEIAKQWEDEDTTDGTSSSKATPVDSTLDVGILKFQPQKIEFKDLQARPESGENPNKLISSLTEEEINQTMERQQRIKSAELLKKEMESPTRHGNREYTKKVNYAVAVGYARQLVGWLFARWPESEDVMTSMLDNIDPHNIVGLLDLIQATETKKHFNVLVFNFIRCCSKQIIQPLALSAVQCMGEVRLATRVCESDHKYKNNAKVEDKVRISGATSLFIRFDDRCSTEYNCDELVLSSSPRMLENRRAFSGSRDWNDFEMPGDTVYYKFTSDSSNTDWGWKFTVTGGQLGRFETGCSILSALLAQGIQFSRRLPLKQLWSWLIVVACNQVGQQRLMATGLILRILQICAGDPYLFGADAEPFPEQNRPNLSLLRPLWTLYTNAIEADTGTSLSLMSPVIRALSELFLVVENVAQDWGEADDLVAGLATDDKMRRCFTRVVRNIAAIGLAIDLPNKAMDLLKNAKDLPAPPRNPIDDSSGSGPSLSRDRKTIELRISDLVSDDDDEDSDDDDDEDDEDMMFENDDDDDDDDDDEDDDDDDSGDDDIDWADLAR